LGTRKQQHVTRMAALLAVPLRYQILQLLLAGPKIVNSLVESLGENQATVSKQLGILRDAGLIVCQPDGRCREYALANPGLVSQVLERLHDLAIVAERQAARCRFRRKSRGTIAATASGRVRPRRRAS